MTGILSMIRSLVVLAALPYAISSLMDRDEEEMTLDMLIAERGLPSKHEVFVSNGDKIPVVLDMSISGTVASYCPRGDDECAAQLSSMLTQMHSRLHEEVVRKAKAKVREESHIFGVRAGLPLVHLTAPARNFAANRRVCHAPSQGQLRRDEDHFEELVSGGNCE